MYYFKITFHLIQNANSKEFTKAHEKTYVLHIHKSMQTYFSIMPYSVKIALKSSIALLLFTHKWSILRLITLLFDSSDEISTCPFKVLFLDICKVNDFILHNTKVYIFGQLYHLACFTWLKAFSLFFFPAALTMIISSSVPHVMEPTLVNKNAVSCWHLSLNVTLHIKREYKILFKNPEKNIHFLHIIWSHEETQSESNKYRWINIEYSYFQI